MPILVKTAIKDFNPAKLLEELAGLPVTSIGWAGFSRVTDRRYGPFAEANRIVGRSSATGDDLAGRGELRLVLSRDLSAAEQTDLDARITVHDPVQLTAEQTRQDRDRADYDDLLDLWNRWGVLTVLEKDRADQRVIRLLLRRLGGPAI